MNDDIVVGQKQPVTLLDGTTVPYVSLDSAASTPAMTCVLQAVTDFMPMYSSVHRGTGLKSRISTERYEAARKTVLNFVGGNEEDHIVIFGSNTTDAINKVAHRLDLQKDDVVIVSMLEHHSNDLPWRQKATLKRISSTKSGGIDLAHLEKLLETHQDKVRLVAVSGASNVTGHITDLERVAELTHTAGAQLLVDAAQLAPHRKINIRKLTDALHIDYLTLSAHKMYAPFGTGALIARKDTFMKGSPDYCGGGTIDFVSLGEVVWTAPPERDEAGTPNVVGAIALATAMQELDGIGMGKVAAHELKLVEYAIKKLSNFDNIKLFGDLDNLEKRTGVITFTVKGYNHALVVAILAAEWGIGVRSGCFCAHPYVIELLGMSEEEVAQVRNTKTGPDSQPVPGLVRVSFGIYNTTVDIDRLLDGLQAIADGKHAKYEYQPETSSYETPGWPK